MTRLLNIGVCYHRMSSDWLYDVLMIFYDIHIVKTS